MVGTGRELTTLVNPLKLAFRGFVIGGWGGSSRYLVSKYWSSCRTQYVPT
jgi:hypothetical protein